VAGRRRSKARCLMRIGDTVTKQLCAGYDRRRGLAARDRTALARAAGDRTCLPGNTHLLRACFGERFYGAGDEGGWHPGLLSNQSKGAPCVRTTSAGPSSPLTKIALWWP